MVHIWERVYGSSTLESPGCASFTRVAPFTHSGRSTMSGVVYSVQSRWGSRCHDDPGTAVPCLTASRVPPCNGRKCNWSVCCRGFRGSMARLPPQLGGLVGGPPHRTSETNYIGPLEVHPEEQSWGVWWRKKKGQPVSNPVTCLK